MSKKNTELFFSEISPFSTVVHEILNTSTFLERALNQLDSYINGKGYTFSAEDALIIIANENWALDEIEITLNPEVVDNEYPRLKLAAQKEVFRNAFCDPNNDYGQRFSLPLELTVFSNENGYMPFSLLEINRRIREAFNLKHTDSLSLLAAAFGFDNANDLSRFDYCFKQALVNWTVVGLNIIPSVSFFERIKGQLDDKLVFGVSVRDLSKTNSPLAYDISFHDKAVTEHIVPQMIKLTEEHELIYQWAKLSELSAEEIPDIFYRQLAKLVWGNKLTVGRVKQLVCCNIFMQNIVSSCMRAYSLAYGSDVLPKQPEVGITSEELQYRWLESIFKQDQIMLDESKKPALKKLQKEMGNTFVDFRLPWPLNMMGDLGELFPN